MWKYSRGLCTGLSAAVVLAGRPVAAQLGQVGEHLEQVELARPAAGGRLELGPRGQVVRQHPALVVRVDVEAEQQAAQVLQAARDPRSAADTSAGSARQVQLDGLGGAGGLASVGVVGERLQPQQRRAGLDLAAHRDRALPQPRPERRAQHRLHLHALQHEHRRARLDLVADRQRRRDDQRGRGGAHARRPRRG